MKPKVIFNQYRQVQAQRARILDAILIPVLADHTIPLRRSPEVTKACLEIFGNVTDDYVLSLRELLDIISAHEWRKKGGGDSVT